MSSVDILVFYVDTKEALNSLISVNAGLTLELDGLKGESGSHVTSFIETFESKCAFCNCPDLKDSRQTGEFYTGALLNDLRKRAAELDAEVEELYFGVVGGNVSCDLKRLCACGKRISKAYSI